jgi:putative transposase
MARGFVYLVAIMDWFSRYVLSWRLSVSLHADFCVEARVAARARHGSPLVCVTDRGGRVASVAVSGVLRGAGVDICMGGGGGGVDCVCVGRRGRWGG